MELLSEAKAVKIRSHIDKYLIADDDQETVRQSRNGSLKRAIWTVEIVGSKNNVIRLKSCYGKYLTASDQPFLLGMTGKKVVQSLPENKFDLKFDWEAIRDGFQLRLKTWCGTYLRGNGGTPPWRNSVTHDEPHTGSTKNWVLWDLEIVNVEAGSFGEYLSSMSSFSSVSDEVLEALSDGVPGSGPDSPLSVVSPVKSSSRLSVFSFKSNKLFSNKVSSLLTY